MAHRCIDIGIIPVDVVIKADFEIAKIMIYESFINRQ